MKIKLISLIVVGYILSGCSVLDYEVKYNPSAAGDWKRYLSEDVRHSCGEFEIKVYNVNVRDVAVIGPPLLPIIPLFSSENKIHIGFEGSDYANDFCPSILIAGKKSEGHRYENDSRKMCYYLVATSEVEFDVNFENGGFSCMLSTLNFKLDSTWGYRPFMLPVLP